jgi:hypothetical protein
MPMSNVQLQLVSFACMYIMHVQAPIMNNRVENKGLFREESNSNRLGGKPYEAFTIGVSIDFCGTNLKLAADLPCKSRASQISSYPENNQSTSTKRLYEISGR